MKNKLRAIIKNKFFLFIAIVAGCFFLLSVFYNIKTGYGLLIGLGVYFILTIVMGDLNSKKVGWDINPDQKNESLLD